jgi:poly [ADP-ribose] polymerase
MFLNEIVLGNPKEINQDDSSLTKESVAKRYKTDSIIARGRVEPDPKCDVTIPGEWGEITVPQGKPIAQPQWGNSTFSQSEYLVYDEGQVRMKYVLQMKF